MPQSLAQIYVHIVFSTKHRIPLIYPKIQPELYAYLATVLKALDSPAIKIGGMPDHTHILCILSRKYTISKVIEEVKKPSSKWMKTKGVELANFNWQNGYGAFSVSHSQIERVKKYIENQREHHRKVTFQEEFRNLLRKHNVPFNERYVWD